MLISGIDIALASTFGITSIPGIPISSVSTFGYILISGIDIALASTFGTTSIPDIPISSVFIFGYILIFDVVSLYIPNIRPVFSHKDLDLSLLFIGIAISGPSSAKYANVGFVIKPPFAYPSGSSSLPIIFLIIFMEPSIGCEKNSTKEFHIAIAPSVASLILLSIHSLVCVNSYPTYSDKLVAPALISFQFCIKYNPAPTKAPKAKATPTTGQDIAAIAVAATVAAAPIPPNPAIKEAAENAAIAAPTPLITDVNTLKSTLPKNSVKVCIAGVACSAKGATNCTSIVLYKLAKAVFMLLSLFCAISSIVLAFMSTAEFVSAIASTAFSPISSHIVPNKFTPA